MTATEHIIRPGQVYEECATSDYWEPRRIRVLGEPGDRWLPGYSKVDVATIDDRGREMRRRALETSQLHATGTTRTGQPRRSGYRLVQDTETGR